MRKCSDGLLVDMVGLEGKVARGCGRVSFGPVPRLVSHLFWMLPEGREQVRRCSDGLLVDMVGLEGKVARGRVKASFAPVGTSV